MLKLLPLCFLILAFSIQPLLASEPEPVLDRQGNPLEPGVGYYVWPLWANNGGLALGETMNKTCPLDVTRNPYIIGLPVTFTVPGLDYIPTLTDLTVNFSLLSTPCFQPTVWKINKVGSGLWFVSTLGVAGDVTSKFKIERLEGEQSCEIYSFKYCPTVPGTLGLCAPIGTYVDAGGTKVMAIGDAIEPYYVRFQKVSTYPRENNQGFSSAY
ncbi:miraculin-like [Abrus precatorius]|uniref:Miraculin-like n=1 Tax=Abrus precatorius TaxID=3816 RepID=A0A8B8LR17_ABRPR|nr:miraculin-like [Abrus precatorius]